MSKQLRRKNIPAPSSATSSDEDDLPRAVDLPAMEEEIRAGTSAGPGVQDVAASVDPSAPEDADWRWRQMAAQLKTLKIVLAQLCELVTPRTALGRADGGPQVAALPPLSAPLATRQEDAILGVAGEEWRSPRREAAILNTLRCDAWGAVLELAMAAYPETEPDLLEPLILGKMLELSRDLGIPMPVCGHKKLTSRAAAKCLDAQFNLRRWKQVTAWTGGPIVEGGAAGWDPKKAVYVPDGGGPQELTAASAQWSARSTPGPQSAPPPRERRDGVPAAGRNNIDCFRCGRKGHYTRDCWARVPGPPQQEASSADVPRKDPPGQASRQAGRDIAGDRRLCSGCAYHGCGDSEHRRPSDPVADTIATHPRRWAFRDTGPGR
ncbi:unnamed protein product [Lampetra fluviatilis]